MTWKRRPSEIRGYNRALYINTDNNDYVRVDYNLKEKKVRLYVELNEDGGASYYSVIQNGTVQAERSVQSGRAGKFAAKFIGQADVFATIPNRDVFNIIKPCYRIERVKASAGAVKQSRLQETRARYFANAEASPYSSDSEEEPVSFIKNFGIYDALDLGISFLLSVGIFFLSGGHLAYSGVVAALAGLVTGGIDIVIRGREPVMFKVLFLFITGGIVYFYGFYFY